MGIGDRIRALREKRGMTQGELALLLKCHYSTISDYERGKSTPPVRILERIAEALGVSPGELFDLPPNLMPFAEGGMIALPVYGVIQAGRPGFLAEVPEEGYRLVDAERVKGGDYKCIKVEGSSMAPQIPHGSVVLVRLQPEVEQEEIAVVVVNDESAATIKRVAFTPDRRQIILKPDNRDPEYATLVLPIRDVRIVGKAEDVFYRLR